MELNNESNERLTLALPHYGREVVNGKSCFKCDEHTSEILAKAGWLEVPKKRRSSYRYWVPTSRTLNDGDCPCVELIVPTRQALLELADSLHKADRPCTIKAPCGLTLNYAKPDAEYGWQARFIASKGPYWKVLCFWIDGRAKWQWWEESGTYFRAVPPKDQRIMVEVEQ